MLFCIKEKDISKNSIAFNSDGSFCYKEQNEAWDFQVMLDSSGRFILNFNSYTKKCTSCEGYFLGYEKKRVFERNINVPNCPDGGLFIADDFDASRLGIEYDSINKQMYFDKEKSLIAIGDIETEHPFYTFGIGQYVAIGDKQNIVSVIVKLDTE